MGLTFAAFIFTVFRVERGIYKRKYKDNKLRRLRLAPLQLPLTK